MWGDISWSLAYFPPSWELPREEGKVGERPAGIQKAATMVLGKGYPVVPLCPPQALGWIRSRTGGEWWLQRRHR